MNERLFDNGSQRVEVPLLCLVAASNELPESEELDALYDRFLLRFHVSQVSEAGLRGLLQLATAPPSAAPPPALLQLDAKVLAEIRATSLASVSLPDEIVDLLCELRTWLQEECEPPVYVSDRRLVKAVAMLRVSAFTCGRREVSEADALLLEHVLWQQPEEAEAIRSWLLRRFTRAGGTVQMGHLFAGLFGRACRSAGRAQECQLLAGEARNLQLAVVSRLRRGCSEADVLQHLWFSGEGAQRAAQTLGPAFDKLRLEQEELLTELFCLEQWLEAGHEAHILALLLPKRWSNWLSSAPTDEVRPLGVVSI